MNAQTSPLFGQGMFTLDPNMTPDQVAKKRAMIAQLIDQPRARYVGEGVGQLASGILAGVQGRKLDKIEGAGQAAATDIFGRLLERQATSASTSGAPGGGLTLGNTTLPQDGSVGLSVGANPTSIDWEQFTTEGGTRPDAISGMTGDFRGGVEAMIAAAPPDIQSALKVGSGYRSVDRQEQLWNEALVKYGSPEAARKWVAPPGKSQHNHGNAADLKFASDEAKQWAHKNAGQFGLVFPLSNEPWHVELAGARGGDAGGGSGVRGGAMPSMNELYGALANPWLNPQQRAVVTSMIQQQAEAADPMRQIQLQTAQLQLDKARAPETPGYRTLTAQEAAQVGLDPGGVYQMGRDGQVSVLQQPPKPQGGGAEYGLNPIMGTDADGNPVVLQLGKDGSAVVSQMPEGVKPDMSLKAYETAQGAALGKGAGEAQVDAQIAYPGAADMAAVVDKQISDLKSDPYLDAMLGPVDSLTPNTTENAARVQGMFDQLQGGAFLQARQMLKGGGAITDYEGRKAEEAFARLNKAQSPEDFKAALDDFNAFVQQGIRKLQAQAQGGSVGLTAGGKTAPAAKVKRYNPATGQIE